jgi:hypothetical protein
MSTVIPALDKHARIRVNATPLDREALPFALQNKLKWPTRVFPIEYVDASGERQPTWPARYPLAWIDKTRRDFEAAGKIQDFMREYMCVADDPARKIFTADMFKVKPTVRTWQPTWAFFDPARTTKSTSATTGWAVWSWTSNRMTVWDGGGDLLKPDEIVSRVFGVDNDYRPIAIGVEEDGLNEFLMQPLRHEMTRRGYIIPVVPMKAPKGKLGFIESLQPYFRAGEITFAKDLPVLQAQFLNFPSGRIDGPNALAYALLMKPGQVVYDDFGADHVVDRETTNSRRPCWLCLHARDGVVTGVLVQYHAGVLSLIADWVVEGDPGAAVAQIVKEASLETSQLKLVAPVEHFGAYNHLGLRGAVAKIPAELHRGSPSEVGRDELRALLQRRVKDRPAVAVAMTARWTLNGFAAGYAYEVGKDGRLTSEPRRGVYRCLMEGLESFTGMLSQGILEDHGKPNVQRTASGQLYISALPGKSEIADAKDAFPSAGAVNASLSARRAS